MATSSSLRRSPVSPPPSSASSSNLAVFFARHVFWPQGSAGAPFAGEFRPEAVLIAAAAFIALWKYQAGILRVIGACAVLGLLLSFVLG